MLDGGDQGPFIMPAYPIVWMNSYFTNLENIERSKGRNSNFPIVYFFITMTYYYNLH